MENQNPLEMQNEQLNPHQPPHLSAKLNCVFCGANLQNSVKPCPNCGAQAEHTEEPYKQAQQTRPEEAPPRRTLQSTKIEAVKSRLEPDHSKPVDKRKLIYSIIIIILALIVISLLPNNGATP